jgi:hypothetical protein
LSSGDETTWNTVLLLLQIFLRDGHQQSRIGIMGLTVDLPVSSIAHQMNGEDERREIGITSSMILVLV